MEQLQSCPCCTSRNLSKKSEIKDYFLSRELFQIDICNECGFQFTNPRPDQNEIGKYYKSDNYISHNSNNTSLFHQLYRFIRTLMTKKKIQTLLRFTNKNINAISLLDYGAASGNFLEACKANQIQHLQGIEQDADCRQFAKQNFQLELKTPEDIGTINNESVDVITLWHVLEHIHNLEECILHFKRILTKDGILAIAVPNINSADAKYYKNYWAALDVPRHLYHFETKTLKTLMERLGFKIVGNMTMPFDSFYISLHSEIYKKQPFIIAAIKAIFVGLYSNLKAKNTNNYSSITLIFKKQ